MIYLFNIKIGHGTRNMFFASVKKGSSSPPKLQPLYSLLKVLSTEMDQAKSGDSFDRSSLKGEARRFSVNFALSPSSESP